MRYKQNIPVRLMIPTRALQQGFTLIETIVGIVVLSIAFSIFTTLIYPLANQSAEQVHQIKAAELGQSMINEILGKAFDENAEMSGGFYRCGEDQNNDGEIKATDGETCTDSVNLGPDNIETKIFDDVDDYHNSLTSIEGSLGNDDSLASLYVGYQVGVQVINDSDYDGDTDGADNNYTAKLITVTVTTPQDFDFVFSVYRVNFLMRRLPKDQLGFTLVELITVIVILGVLASSISSFLRFGTKSYTDAADREALISTARFVVERLNREVRNALPNSIRTIGVSNQCLEFVPIDKSVIYLDIPVAPELASNSVDVLMLEESLLSTTQYTAVYALNSDDIYNTAPGVIEAFSSVDNSGNKQTPSKINFASSLLFNAESPTSRLYFISTPVSYCVENNAVYRYQGYGFGSYNGDGTPSANANRVLMAEYVGNYSVAGDVLPFQTFPATLQRNGLALTRLKFVRNLEEIVFNNEIQVPNVP